MPWLYDVRLTNQLPLVSVLTCLPALLFPLNGMSANAREPRSISIRLPSANSLLCPTHSVDWVEKATVRVKSLASEHVRITTARNHVCTTQSGVWFGNPQSKMLHLTHTSLLDVADFFPSHHHTVCGTAWGENTRWDTSFSPNLHF